MRRLLLFKLLNNCTVALLTELVFLPLSTLFPPRPLLSVTTTSHIAICCNLSFSFPSLPLLCFQLTLSSLPPSPCLLASVRPLCLWAIGVIHCCGTNHPHAGLPLPRPHPFFLSLLHASLPSSLGCGCLPSPTAGHCYTALPRLCLISHRMAAWQEWRDAESKRGDI